MNFVRYALFSFVFLTLAAGSVRAQGVYEYVDNFSTDKALSDCYVASSLWPSDINNPPPRPYLTYVGAGDARGLALMDYRGELAQLGYSFPVGTAPTGGSVKGTLRLDVSFPCNEEFSQFPPGQLLCSISPDGLAWSAPQSLSAGHQDIAIQSAKGTCYVLLSGTRAVIDNLRVSLSLPGAAVRVPQNNSTRLVSSVAAHAIYHVDVTRRRSSSYATIQAAIDKAQNGDTVVVWPGVYQEEIRFDRKAITVQSAADAAVLTAPGGYAVSFYGAEGSKSILANFVITGCSEGAVFCDGASPTLRNLTLASNEAGIVAYGGANPYIVNCIFWKNATALSAWKANFNWQISYSCFDQSNPNKGVGNISADPRFADPQNGDYHLKSPWGRYVPGTDTWVLDVATSPSPCIDAGDLADTPRAELVPNGGRIDMGAYGGTPFASKSSGPACP